MSKNRQSCENVIITHTPLVQAMFTFASFNKLAENFTGIGQSLLDSPTAGSYLSVSRICASKTFFFHLCREVGVPWLSSPERYRGISARGLMRVQTAWDFMLKLLPGDYGLQQTRVLAQILVTVPVVFQMQRSLYTLLTRHVCIPPPLQKTLFFLK